MKRIGPYDVIRRLGQGAFGCVYLARDRKLGSQVAIKIAQGGKASESGRPDAIPDSGDRARINNRLLAESRSLLQLNHPGIVSVLNVGIDAETAYIVSEFIDGPTLEQAMRLRSFDWRGSVDVVVAVADALEHAHAHRVIHRDLKPANIILDPSSRPVLVDFDLAIDETSGRHNAKGDLAGTLAYMSPEQVIGEGHRLDGRTDIYSLGVVLYRMLTGRLPFQSKSSSELKRQIREDDPQPLRQLMPTLPLALERVCLKAIAKDYFNRYTTAGDFADSLQGVLDSEDDSVFPLPVPDVFHDDSASTASSVSGIIGSSQRRAGQLVRRRVTMVRCECDVFESPEISQRLDLEEQNDILGEFRNLGRSAAEELNGAVAQWTEQGLLLCFGYPVAAEDATQNAVRVGLHVQSRFGQLSDRVFRRHSVHIHGRVAVHTDEAVLQTSAEGMLSVSGGMLTMVGKMVASASGGDVAVSETTRRIVTGYFSTAPAGTLNGPGGPLRVHRVVGERASGRFEAAELTGELTPLVGRQREITQLHDKWQQACHGQTQFVSLSGSPGMGKSRLIHELKVHLDSRNAGDSSSIIQWQTSSQLQNTAWAPVIACFERILGFDAEPTPIKRLSLIVSHLDDLQMEGDEEVGLLADLLSVPLAGCYPKLSMGPAEKRQKTLSLLLRWIQNCARQRSTLFTIEDLHWADPSTLEFVEALMGAPEIGSLMTVVTFRPEFQTRWSKEVSHRGIQLDRISKDQIREVLAGKAGNREIPDAVVDRVDIRTDGVPLFVEEVASTLIAGDANTDQDQNDIGLDELNGNNVPESLQDLLMSRLHRVASDIETVQLAATIGRDFDEALICAVSDRNDGELRDEFENLVDSGLLQRQDQGVKRSFIFKHALIQDAAYTSLTRDHRRRMHERIADTMQRQFQSLGQRQPEVLALHYTRADRPEQAIEYWEQAGQQATERGANLEAERHLMMAIEQLPHLTPEMGWPDDRRERLEVKLRVMLGVHLQLMHGYSAPEIHDNYQKAIQASERLGDPLVQAPLLYGLFRSDMMIGRLHRAREIAEQLMALADRVDRPAFKLIAARSMGSIAFFFGDLDSSSRYLEELLSFAPTPELIHEIEQFDPVDPWIVARSYLSAVLWLSGYPDQSVTLIEETKRLAATQEKPMGSIFSTGFSQWVHQFRGDVERTLQSCDRSDQLGKEYGFPFWNAWTTTIRGWTLDTRGRSVEGIPVFRKGMKEWKNASMGHSYFLVLLAEACIHANQIDEAAGVLDEAEQCIVQTGESFYASEIARVRGELALRSQPAHQREAGQKFIEAMQIAHDQNARSLQLRAAHSLASLKVMQRKRVEAREILAPVFEQFEEGFETRDVKAAQDLMDELAD